MFCPEEINTFTHSRQDYFEDGIDSTCTSALVQIVYFSKDRGGILTKPFQWDVNESLVVRFTDKSPLLAWAGQVSRLSLSFLISWRQNKAEVGFFQATQHCEVSEEGPAIRKVASRLSLLPGSPWLLWHLSPIFICWSTSLLPHFNVLLGQKTKSPSAGPQNWYLYVVALTSAVTWQATPSNLHFWRVTMEEVLSTNYHVYGCPYCVHALICISDRASMLLK